MSSEPQFHGTYDPRSVGSALRAHKWSAMAVILIVVAGGALLSWRQTPVYQSTAEVVVPRPIASVGTGGSVTFGNVALEDEAKIAAGEPIAARVAKRIGFEGSLQSLRDRVQVVPGKGTDLVLQFNAQDADPGVAAEAANTFAETYLEDRSADILYGLTNTLESTQSRLLEVSKRLSNTSPEKPQYAILLQEQSSLSASRNDLASAVRRLKQGQGQVLQVGVAAADPVRPNHPRDLAIAFVAGLALAVVLSMFLVSIDTKARSTEDVEALTGASLLGGIPHFPHARGQVAGVVTIADPRSPASEAYRTLRTGLLFVIPTSRMRSIGVTSSEKGEGKSTTSVNLAVVTAQADQRVLLIDGDLRRPSVHRLLDLHNDTGLSSVLSGQVELVAAVQKSSLPRLRVLTSGPIPPNPVELLGSPAMEDLMEQAAELFDWVIVDAPPALGVADASVIAGHVDGMLFVVSESTNRKAVANARDQLAKIEARVIGAVLNNLTRRSRSSYPGYDYSRYAYEGYRSRRADRKRARADEEARSLGLTESDPASPGGGTS